MRPAEAFARLQALHRRVFVSSEAAAAWGISATATAKALARLVEDGLLVKLRHGMFALPEAWGAPVDPLDVLPVLTRPYPSYASLWTALFHHGMIEQVPRAIYAVSVDRAKIVSTSIGDFHIHAVTTELFGGTAGATESRAGIATPEKALFDTVYLLSAGVGRASLPELELPASFSPKELFAWVDRVPSTRLRTLTVRHLSAVVGPPAPRPSGQLANLEPHPVPSPSPQLQRGL